MKLKSVEIQGFKSFPDKTRLEFSQPITAVVGPNGSGKSNIGDAIRWVLGEQSSKTLRGAKMEDVIFGGTQQRKAMGFASVMLTIDNDDRAIDIQNDEVAITRKIYRSGESEYKINNSTVRLKDIHELFMDTGLGRDGYSIIGQGKIAEIISSKSTDRREIFEEAAGIAKYRYHKIEAQKRLTMAEENLNRLKDILVELEERIEPLKKDSEKASKFIVLAEEKKTLEISIWLDIIEKSKASIKEQEDKIMICKADYDEIVGQIDEIEKNISDIFLKMQNCSVQMEADRAKIKETEASISELTAQKAVAENNIEHNSKSAAEVRDELSKLNISKDDLNVEIENRREKIIDIEKILKGLSDEKNDISQKSNNENEEINTLNSEINRFKAQRAALYTKISEAKLKSATSSTVVDQSSRRLDEVRREIELSEENAKERQENFEQINDAILTLDEKKQELTNEKSGYTIKLQSRNTKFDEQKKMQNQIQDSIKEKNQRSKLLSDMEKSMEGFSYSVKFIHKASETGELMGISGTVSSAIEVDSKYSLAIETALGGALQNIIVKDEYIAKQAISLLAKNKAGRATFLPITSVKGNFLDINSIKNSDGFVGLATSLVKYDEKFSGIMASLLGRIIVATDLDSATDIAKTNGYKFKIVTLDGQVINAGGSFTGGSHSQSVGILSRRAEIDELTKKALEQQKDLDIISQQIEKLQREISAINAQIHALESEIEVLEEDRQMMISERMGLEYNIKNEDKKLEMFAQEKKSLQVKINEFNENNNTAKNLLASLDDELVKSEENITQATQQKENLSVSLNENSSKLNEIEMKILAHNKDGEQLIQSIFNLTSQQSEQEQKKLDLNEKIKKYENENYEITQAIKNFADKTVIGESLIEKLQENIKIVTAQRTAFEQETTNLRNSTKNISSTKEKLSAEMGRLEERKISLQNEYDSIISKLWEEYELTRTEAQKFAQKLEDTQIAQKRLMELRVKIKSLGNVNVGAIEEFKEVSERYNFMKAQVDDVLKSKEQLNKLIYDLTSQMCEIFSNQFNLINQNFKRIFVELFGGGKASLYLTTPEDILESGIEISVEPPGKIIKNLTALSGGEQSFVAVALYFAILNVNPSPFCILDEIEAALDDVNVTKYAKYLRKLSNNTQFIAITHRRGTMEEADTLYGVTMQEEGVSKLLELNVTEIEGRLGMKTESI
ncbi:MAG: chromosome segregation protein SMC [Oscillospiraceae bacterium]